MRYFVLFFLAVCNLCSQAQVMAVEHSIPATDVFDLSGFAGGRIAKNEEVYLRRFDIAKYVGLVEERSFTAWDWRPGEQPGKWLESAIITSKRSNDELLRVKAREMYDRMLRSQDADGYIGVTSKAARTPDKSLRGMDAYELYFTQHALLTAFDVWKDAKGLNAARKLGDYFLDHIGPGKAEFWPTAIHDPENKGKVLKGTQHSDIAGHSIHYGWEGTLLIDPMMRLYEKTGDKRYLDWCKWVVSNIDKWSGWDAYSNLDKVAAGTMPIDKVQPYVHAHTFQMNFLGLLRMYRATGNRSYLDKVTGAWKDVASRQLYLTGGVSVGEHYERDFVRPMTGKMEETCATMSWIQLSQSLLELTGEVKYADAIERILWNQVFAEQTIDGDANRYDTPPNGYVPEGYFREPDCCMGSGHRLLSMLPGFIYGYGTAGSIYINQYIPSTTRYGHTQLTQHSSYPSDGKIAIDVQPATASKFAIHVRIPVWCRGATVQVNGQELSGINPGSYVSIVRTWKPGDKIILDLPMELRWVQHDHYLRTSDRKPYKTEADGDAPYALTRGPVVYAANAIWYRGDTSDLRHGWIDTVKYVLDDPAGFTTLAAPSKEILGPGYEVQLLLADGRKVTMPVYPFANIGKWYRDAAHKPDSNASTWGYAIWLKGSGAAPAAALAMPAIFGDNMVLQRNMPVPVWGTAAAGMTVRVRFGQQFRETKADARGQWAVTLDAMAASSTPAEMTVSGDGRQIVYKNILVGEVWLCSGQSNMEYSMRKTSKFELTAHGSGPAGELDKAANPAIRIFLVRTNYSKPDTVHIRRAWDEATGAPLRDFSAAGYFFAKELYNKLGVPVGIISSAVPGSAIEPWLPVAGAKFYENMVRPLAPYALKGWCWYQGETNCMLNDTIAYAAKMASLINGWRKLWQLPDASFYFVQIAPYYYSRSQGGDQPHTTELEPAFWEAQARALSLPHTGMVVTTDLVDSLQDLHPAYKWEIGRRLALWALAKDYKLRDIVYSGPVFREAHLKGPAVMLGFDQVGSGLVSRGDRALNWFELSDGDGRWVKGDAVVKGDQVEVQAAKLTAPVAVRFGWNEGAQPNLYNKEGLPAMPFRAQLGSGQETEKLFLSGTGKDQTVDWQFYCTEGRNSRQWTKIPVPSNWELQGFGKYNYGLDKDSVRGHEKGLYKYNFKAPASWKGRVINIVFDGSMTDTEVKINGRSAGAIHQGSFYRFKYDISGLLKYGRSNLLEVTVAKESANRSVNWAERHCDFWLFGGIFRPVFLEAMPVQRIVTHAIDAKADGQIQAVLRVAGVPAPTRLSARVYTLSGQPVGETMSAEVRPGDSVVRISGRIDAVRSWSPESPNLYKIVYSLGEGRHTVEQRFGFRTVELRERDGIYVNGVKIKFKGVCRHSFWPGSGRTLSKSLSIEDVQLMKDMNMNAVRMSHYPPDDHFLDVCDSLGLFVLDELTGWHHAYDTEVGSKLVKEMIEKDVNHPSIVMWDNGNEGGFNFDLDPLFDQYDLQRRPLTHPWAVFRGTDTQHYINYDYGNGTHLHGHDIVFPTEFLHGLYDGGHGAGLRDFWEQMYAEPLSAGGFLWDFSDEAVVRTDRNGTLDADGDHGPDGILGPYREKEGSYNAIREIWAPVFFPRREITAAFDGKIVVENRWLYTNLRDCRFSWRLAKLGGDSISGDAVVPSVTPGAKGELDLQLPSGWRDHDVFYLEAFDPFGRSIYTWSWPLVRPGDYIKRLIDTTGGSAVTMADGDTSWTIAAAGIKVSFGKKTGLLRAAENSKGAIEFRNGPVLSAGIAEPTQVSCHQEGRTVIVEAMYGKGSLCERLRWTMYASGWLKMDIHYFAPDYDYHLLGVNFDSPEKGADSVQGIRWIGDGPYRVWKNRMDGAELGLYHNKYNNTITGQGACIYPEFKGYYSNFYWMRLERSGQPVTIACANEDVFLRLYTPDSPAHVYNTAPPFPSGDISFMQAIPAIGTKSQKPERLGPSGQKNMYYDYGKSPEYAKQLQLYFDFSGK